MSHIILPFVLLICNILNDSIAFCLCPRQKQFFSYVTPHKDLLPKKNHFHKSRINRWAKNRKKYSIEETYQYHGRIELVFLLESAFRFWKVVYLYEDFK